MLVNELAAWLQTTGWIFAKLWQRLDKLAENESGRRLQNLGLRQILDRVRQPLGRRLLSMHL